MSEEKLNSLMKVLAKKGCYPSIYRRGQIWRAHVNAAGNCWDEGTTPLIAMQKAVRAWKKAGMPMDGYADSKGGRR